MDYSVRCKCGHEVVAGSQAAVRCPACGRVIHIVRLEKFEMAPAKAKAARSPALHARVTQAGTAAGELISEHLLQHPLRIVVGVAVLAFLVVLFGTLGVLRPKPSPLQEEFDFAMSLVERGKGQMARPILVSIATKSPRSSLGRRARQQISLLGPAPAPPIAQAGEEPLQAAGTAGSPSVPSP
jgi:hypothetical protein